MSDEKTNTTELNEDDLVGLLAGLKREPHPEANFEDRFVHDFRECVARYAATRPARKVLWDHIMLRLTSIGKVKYACGATTLGVSALAIGFFSWSSEPSENQPRIAPTIGSVRVVEKPAPQQPQQSEPDKVAAVIDLDSPVGLSPLIVEFEKAASVTSNLSAADYPVSSGWRCQSEVLKNNTEYRNNSLSPVLKASYPQYTTLPLSGDSLPSVPSSM